MREMFGVALCSLYPIYDSNKMSTESGAGNMTLQGLTFQCFLNAVPLRILYLHVEE